MVNKKEAILNSVLKAVTKEGFYHLNMKKIAEGAGISPGTIYLYFKGKEELINELYRMIQNDFNQSVARKYMEDKPMLESFLAMLDQAVKFYINDPDKFSFIEQYTYAPFLFKEAKEENFALMRPLFRMINKGKETQVFKDISNLILVGIIHGSMNTMIKMHLAFKIDLQNKEERHEFYRACWNAIVNPDFSLKDSKSLSIN